jgi:hypothetical protein
MQTFQGVNIAEGSHADADGSRHPRSGLDANSTPSERTTRVRVGEYDAAHDIFTRIE